MNELPEFTPFPKMPRLSREMIVSEKIDGTNGQIFINDERNQLLVGSRSRWLTKEADNFGFHKWAMEHYDYGLKEKRFSLFNVMRWVDKRHLHIFPFVDPKQEYAPECCHVVPVLHSGEFSTETIGTQIDRLRAFGSFAAPGFMRPEGVVAWHVAGNFGMKKTLERDEKPKTQS